MENRSRDSPSERREEARTDGGRDVGEIGVVEGGRAFHVVAGLRRHAAEIESGPLDAAGAGVVGGEQEGTLVGFPFRLPGQQAFLQIGEVGGAYAAIQGRLEGPVERDGLSEQPDGHVPPGPGLELHEAPFAVAADLEGIAVGFDLDDGFHEAGGVLFGIHKGRRRRGGSAGKARRRMVGAEGGNPHGEQQGRHKDGSAADGGERFHIVEDKTLHYSL